jgi:hypothetical protein
MDAPDGPDAGDDATMEGSGLVLAFTSEPNVGGSVDGDYDAVLGEVEIRLEDVRVIGDAALGDERTSVGALELEWESKDTIYVRFPQAPPGMYSQLLGDVVSYEISGTIEIDGESKSFTIGEEEANFGFSEGLSNVNLEPSAALELPVRVDIAKVIREINWRDVGEGEEGKLRIGEGSSEIDSVRGKLKEMFEVQASQPIEP